jgi:hypothetical protein
MAAESVRTQIVHFESPNGLYVSTVEVEIPEGGDMRACAIPFILEQAQHDGFNGVPDDTWIIELELDDDDESDII